MIDKDSCVKLTKLISEISEKGLPRSVELFLNEDPSISGIASLEAAQQQDISFLSNPKFFNLLSTTRAGAVVMPSIALEALDKLPNINPSKPPFAVVICENPYLMYSRLTQWFYNKENAHIEANVHPSAVISTEAILGHSVVIGPNVVVEDNVKIGDRVQIRAGSVICKGATIGYETVIYPNVTIYPNVSIGSKCIIHSGAVIGSDGFGFAPDNSETKGAWSKIHQFGSVIIEDDVEIGSNTCIDRGALSDTIIRKGAKLDNLIMIAHNCDIGQNVAMAACVGVAGSTKIGDRCTLAGASMVSGHLTIGDDIHISGGTGVMNDISEPGRYTGLYPIESHKEWQKNAAALKSLYDLRKRVLELEKNMKITVISNID